MSNNIDLYIQEIEISKADIKGAIQSKGVTPTGGLSSYAEAILSIPTGTPMAPLNETITESGVYNYNPIDDGVGGYNSVEINVDIDIPTFETQSKEVTIKKNGTTSIVPDSGYDGLSEVNVTVQVSTGGSDKPQILNGFAFTGGDIAQVDFSQYDWSKVYDPSFFFQGCTHSTGDWTNFEENFNGDIMSLYYMFAGKTTSPYEGVKTLPNLGNKTADVTSTAYMCYYNRNLDDATAISRWDTSKVMDASYMFGSNQNQSSYNPKITTIDLTNFGSPDGYKADYMFRGCGYLESVVGAHPAGIATYMFANCPKLTSIPQLDTSNVTDMSYMFSSCSSLTSIPQLDTSKATNMYCMFALCSSLTSIPQLDTSKATNMGYMFQRCSKLTSIPQLDTSNVTDMKYMFSACSGLTSFPEIDTSNVTSAAGMFENCSKLTSIPQLNFRSLTGTTSQLCYSCTSLIEVGNINFENATYLSSIFKSCSNLTSIGDVICPNNKMFYGSYSSDSWVYGCPKLQKIGVVDCDSLTDLRYIFTGGTMDNLTEFGGCRNLGKASSVSNTNSNYGLNMAPNLNYQSVLNILNGLYDRASAGLSVLTLRLHANNLAMLSDDDIAIATNKGWTIV